MIFAFLFVIDLILGFFALVFGGVGVGMITIFRRGQPSAGGADLLVGGSWLAFLVASALLSFYALPPSLPSRPYVMVGSFAVAALALLGLVVGAFRMRGERRVDRIVGYVLLAIGMICLGLAFGNIVWNIYTINTYCPTHSSGCA